MNSDTNGPEGHHWSSAAELSLIDEHVRVSSASNAGVWSALVAHLASTNNRPTSAYASIVGFCPRRAAGEFPSLGSALPGFAVSDVDPLHRLVLAGSHRFSRYTLIFLLEPRDEGTVISARSHAEFPGLQGRAYRAAVVGSRAHRIVVRRLLRSVDRRAHAKVIRRTMGNVEARPRSTGTDDKALGVDTATKVSGTSSSHHPAGALIASWLG